MGLMMLAAVPGASIEIAAQGSDALAAVAALSDLVERKFDEDE
jgi:phosphocarrier protein